MIRNERFKFVRSVRQRFALTLILVFASRSCAENWPEFRGPTGQGTSAAIGLPVTWDATRGVAWRIAIEGRGWSSPVLHEGRIYLSTAVPTANADEQSLQAVCIDAANGTKVWQREIFRQPMTADASIHTKNSFASPTPLVRGQRLYVHFGPNGTAALDIDGNLIWANRDIRYDARHGGGGSPIASGELLVFNCDGVEQPFVVALSLDSGEERWRTYRPDMEPERFSFSTPLEIEVRGKRQIVGPGSRYVCSYDPASGSELWRVGYPRKWSVIPRPVYAHGLVFVCTGYEGPAELLAIWPDGKGDVTETHVAWRTDKHVPHTPSPLIVGNQLFMITDNGIATCRDVMTGDLRWRKRLRGAYSASPIYADGRIYFPNEEGLCSVVAASDEFEQLAENDVGEPTLASYAVDDGALLIRTAEHLFRIDSRPQTAP